MLYNGKSCYISGHYTDDACTLGMLSVPASLLELD